MTMELDVLALVGERLDACHLPHMLTGSFALAYYATPRMTRDLDIVVQIAEPDIGPLVTAFSTDFYIDPDVARDAIRTERLFNLMHLETGIKVDFIVRKSSEYRKAEFERRQRVQFGDVSVWIVSREDLILSKLVWARDTGSEQQRRDIRSLLAEATDMPYIQRWAIPLGVASLLAEFNP